MFKIAVTPHIALHLPMDQDSAAFFALTEANREHIGQFISWAQDKDSIDAIRRYLRDAREHFAQRDSVLALVKVDDEIAGMVVLYIHNSVARVGEMGYWLGEAWAGQGIMTQCVRTMLDYAFATLGLNKVKMLCATENLASRRLIEGLNLKHEGRLRAEGHSGEQLFDLEVYAIFADEWPRPATAPEFMLRIGDDLALRLFEDRHAETLHSLTQHNYDHLRRWLGWLKPDRSLDDTQGFITGALNQFARNDGGQFGIWYQGELVGGIGYHGWDFSQKTTELGYWLSADATGQGLMTRAVVALTDFALVQLGLNRIEIRCAVGNDASAAIPRRLGFQHEGTLRQEEWLYTRFIDLEIYSMLAADWASAKKGNA